MGPGNAHRWMSRSSEGLVGSDHHLVTAVLRVKLRKTRSKKTARKHLNVGKLRDSKVRGQFVLQLKNRFQELTDMFDDREKKTDNINSMWKQKLLTKLDEGKPELINGHTQKILPVKQSRQLKSGSKGKYTKPLK